MPATLSFLNHLMILFFRLFMITLVDNTRFFFYISSTCARHTMSCHWVYLGKARCISFAVIQLAQNGYTLAVILTIIKRVSEVRLWRISADCIQRQQQLSPFDNKTNIHSRGVQEHRHVDGAFLLWHSSKAPVLIIRQPHKSGGGLASCYSPPLSTLG